MFNRPLFNRCGGAPAASHDELARLRALMPRLAEAFKADTSGLAKGGRKGGRATIASHGEQMGNGGRATIESHGEQMGNGGRKSTTRFP